MNCIEDGWMRKVGIMSMQRIANYGSFLQAYALKQLIEEVGCNLNPDVLLYVRGDVLPLI